MSGFPLRSLGRATRGSVKSKNSDSDDVPILVNMGNTMGDSSNTSSGGTGGDVYGFQDLDDDNRSGTSKGK